MKNTPRQHAVNILNSVFQSSAFAGDLLDQCLNRWHLSGTADGRLLTHLVYGVLRMQGHLDWILAHLYRGNYDRMEESVKNILRVGLYQLKFSDRLPDFAAVDEAVKIAKHTHPAASGLVNGILRNYLRQKDKLPFPSAEKKPAQHIAAFYAHPLWLVKIWLASLGFAETVTLCRANNEPAPVTLRVNTLKISRDKLADNLRSGGFPCDPTVFSPDGIHLSDSPFPVQKTDYFQAGLLRLQDEAAQLVSYLVDPQLGESILDTCAGSGGKTTHLAALMKNEGRLIALDRDQNKIAQLDEETKRLGIAIVTSRVADLSRPLPPDLTGQFDRVLVDAPCSGTGTLRRNPEIKWRLAETDIQSSSQTQQTILHNASLAVKKGGRLIYCTCSLLSGENEDVVGNFLAEHPHFTLYPEPRPPINNLLNNEGFFKTSPHEHSLDGFFGAVMQRRF